VLALFYRGGFGCFLMWNFWWWAPILSWSPFKQYCILIRKNSKKITQLIEYTRTKNLRRKFYPYREHISCTLTLHLVCWDLIRLQSKVDTSEVTIANKWKLLKKTTYYDCTVCTWQHITQYLHPQSCFVHLPWKIVECKVPESGTYGSRLVWQYSLYKSCTGRGSCCVV